MSGKIDLEQVRQVAKLSRLEITDEEAQRFSTELSAILSYIENLNELDTTDVEPLAHSLPVHNVFREDRIHPSLPVEQALSNAPQQVDEYYKVPRILDESSGA